MRTLTGADILCSTLERLGATHVFGMPGTQNVSLFEALRTSSLRTVLAGSELSASMMANGYYRASGKVGILATIPGPGFTFAIPGIAEASQDSAAVLYITGKPASHQGKQFALQAIDQYAILKPLVRRIVEVDSIGQIEAAVAEAFAAATCSEPGPVLLHVDERIMAAQTGYVPSHLFQSQAHRQPQSQAHTQVGQPELAQPQIRATDRISIAEAAQLLSAARRVVIYAGQGASGAHEDLARLAIRLNAPVVATRSARGVLSDNHPLSLVFDHTSGSVDALNSLLDSADLVLAIGCKFTYNGSYGFRLRLDPAKLIHVDASPLNLNVNYPARLALCADAALFLKSLLLEKALLLENPPQRDSTRGWSADELNRLRRQGIGDVPEPSLPSISPRTPRDFFAALRKALPDLSCLVTDSGQHQVLATRYFLVRAPRGLVIPTDFQSMGFGLPAAIGAKLACPERTVVALIGDGGLLMSGMEIAAAVRENIPLTIIVLNDRALGQIRSQQQSSYGRTYATDLHVPDLELFASAIGAKYIFLRDQPEAILRKTFAGPGVTIVEVAVATSTRMRVQQAKGMVRQATQRNRRLQWITRRIRALRTPQPTKIR